MLLTWKWKTLTYNWATIQYRWRYRIWRKCCSNICSESRRIFQYYYK